MSYVSTEIVEGPFFINKALPGFETYMYCLVKGGITVYFPLKEFPISALSEPELFIVYFEPQDYVEVPGFIISKDYIA